ncbi:MAG: ATP-binding cassette domain-containing protein, partial [Flavobacteriales bacterium]|nr:ATP-binding cassette domain-containing protein [Flavobacteriales bacterium]
MMSDQQIIFSMNRVSKTFPSNNKQVLKDIHLSFFYGAKIGIIGLNGSGKSTLRKIIAGIDKSFQGDVHFSKDHSIGYLAQEPEMDESKTVMDIVKEGMQEAVDLIAEYNDINNQFGLPEVYENPDKMEKLMAKQGELQDQIDA